MDLDYFSVFAIIHQKKHTLSDLSNTININSYNIIDEEFIDKKPYGRKLDPSLPYLANFDRSFFDNKLQFIIQTILIQAAIHYTYKMIEFINGRTIFQPVRSNRRGFHASHLGITKNNESDVVSPAIERVHNNGALSPSSKWVFTSKGLTEEQLQKINEIARDRGALIDYIAEIIDKKSFRAFAHTYFNRAQNMTVNIPSIYNVNNDRHLEKTLIFTAKEVLEAAGRRELNPVDATLKFHLKTIEVLETFIENVSEQRNSLKKFHDAEDIIADKNSSNEDVINAANVILRERAFLSKNLQGTKKLYRDVKFARSDYSALKKVTLKEGIKVRRESSRARLRHVEKKLGAMYDYYVELHRSALEIDKRGISEMYKTIFGDPGQTTPDTPHTAQKVIEITKSNPIRKKLFA